jgi:hypothetical protein
MSARLEIRGIDELKAALMTLPASLADRGGAIVMQSGREAAAAIVARYPERSGALRRGVKVTEKSSAHGTTAIVKSAAPHGWLYEHGTQARHTSLGYARGMMPAPPSPVFVPEMRRARAAMYRQFVSLLERYGVSVTER